jgi:hypothetical protein
MLIGLCKSCSGKIPIYIFLNIIKHATYLNSYLSGIIFCELLYVSFLLTAMAAGSNPAEGMDVFLLCLYVMLSCVGRGLCDGLITRLKESYHVS